MAVDKDARSIRDSREPSQTVFGRHRPRSPNCRITDAPGHRSGQLTFVAARSAGNRLKNTSPTALVIIWRSSGASNRLVANS